MRQAGKKSAILSSSVRFVFLLNLSVRPTQEAKRWQRCIHYRRRRFPAAVLGSTTCATHGHNPPQQSCY